MEIDLHFSKICVQCGMCCDGTLFPQAKVKNSDDELLAKSLGLTTFSTSNNKTFFELPCSLFNKCCTIYDKPRPNTCSKFMCEPLQKVLSSEISFKDAEQQILLALKNRRQVTATASLIPEFKSYTLQQLLAEITPAPSPEILQHKHLLLKLVSLRVVLSKLIKNKL
jgi:hypothetical protein